MTCTDGGSQNADKDHFKYHASALHWHRPNNLSLSALPSLAQVLAHLHSIKLAQSFAEFENYVPLWLSHALCAIIYGAKLAQNFSWHDSNFLSASSVFLKVGKTFVKPFCMSSTAPIWRGHL